MDSAQVVGRRVAHSLVVALVLYGCGGATIVAGEVRAQRNGGGRAAETDGETALGGCSSRSKRAADGRLRPRGHDLSAGEHHPFPPCEEPLRWLAYLRPPEFHDVYCRRCSSHLCRSDGAGSVPATRYPPAGPSWTGLWTFVDAVAHPAGAFWCNERQYVRHLIGAQLGLPVPPGRFARYFAHQRWFVPQSYRLLSDLPAAARDNIAWLDAMVDRCDEEPGRPSSDDLELVDAWFDAAFEGSSPLPEKLYDNCKPLEREVFMTMMKDEPFWRYSPRTPVVVEVGLPCPEPLPPRARAISVHVGAWLTTEPCTECEGHQSLVFVMVDDELVSLNAFLSG